MVAAPFFRAPLVVLFVCVTRAAAAEPLPPPQDNNFSPAAASQPPPQVDPATQPPDVPADPRPTTNPNALDPEGTPLPIAPSVPHEASRTEGSDDITLDEWSRDDWMLIKPKVSLIDVDGYLRIRGTVLQRMDFGNGAKWEVSASGDPLGRYPALDNGAANFSYTDMRLRLEPRINVNEQAQVLTTVDFFDNLILGSTPDALTPGIAVPPVNILSRSQQVPRRNENTLVDAIAIKRLWGRVTALNEQLELRFGRMPDHWGLGMLYNNGDCLDCNWGTTVDRLAIAFRIYNHVFSPMVDWVSRGPSLRIFGAYDPMPIDAVALDDTMQYALRVSHDDHPDDIRDTTLRGGEVVNYGMSNAFRLQDSEYPASYYSNGAEGYDPTQPPAVVLEKRNGFLYVGDVYARYYSGNFELDVEAALEAGSFEDTLVGLSSGQNQSTAMLQTTSVFKVGAAVEAMYHLRGDLHGVTLSLKTGGASGDGHHGFGALDLADTQRGSGAAGDLTLHNFQFSPDYHLDLLLFRRILGTVTDAWYIRPEASYRFGDKLLGRLNAVYSQAMKAASTPSSLGAVPDKPLGVEFDGELSYGLDTNLERGQFLAALAGGVLFPLGAFNNPTATTISAQSAQFVWMVQLRMALTF